MILTDEKERSTTRYVNITAVATFFSSVTATTLQMTISAPTHSVLWNVVNLFWSVSLVFSVSSGVSSLLGMTWRKSSMCVTYCSVWMYLPIDPNRYDTTTPPWLIKLWLDKAPMIFLVISALLFVLGLNLFAYLSSQVSVPLTIRVILLKANRHAMCRWRQMCSRVCTVYAYLP